MWVYYCPLISFSYVSSNCSNLIPSCKNRWDSLRRCRFAPLNPHHPVIYCVPTSVVSSRIIIISLPNTSTSWRTPPISNHRGPLSDASHWATQSRGVDSSGTSTACTWFHISCPQNESELGIFVFVRFVVTQWYWYLLKYPGAPFSAKSWMSIGIVTVGGLGWSCRLSCRRCLSLSIYRFNAVPRRFFCLVNTLESFVFPCENSLRRLQIGLFCIAYQ